MAQILASLAIVEQAAAQRGITVSDAELHTRMTTELQQIQPRVPKGQDLLKFLRDHAVPPSRIAISIRTQMLLEKLADIDFKPDKYVRVASLIIRQKDETTAALSAALASANAAYAALNKGDAWDGVIQKYSTMENAAANHGERGWVAVSDMPKEIQNSALTVKLNGYLPPTQDQNGIEIFRVEARGKDATPAELVELKSRYLPAIGQAIMQQLQKNAKIEYSY